MKYQIQFVGSGRRHPLEFDTYRQAKDYAEGMAWYAGWRIVRG